MTGLIYIAANRVNGKAYVGASKRPWPMRVREHTYWLGNRKKQLFCRAVRRYGIQSFTFGQLETCPTSELVDREIHWIKRLGSRCPNGYNVSEGGQGSRGVRHTEKAKSRIRSAFLGKPKSQQHREHMRGPKSAEHIANSRKARASVEYKVRASEGQRRAWLTRSHEVQSERTKEQWRKWRELHALTR